MTYRRSLSVMTFFALCVAGCGSDPAARPVTAAGGGPNQPAAQAAPAEGSLRIDDRIAKACNMPKALFPFDSARISSDATGALDAVSTCFVSGPLAGRRMNIVGHADPRGETQYNFGLGQKRAGAVAEYVTRHGMDAGKVATSSKGELDATGVDEAGWALDRRVEILLGD